jgi:hypothetical protein
MFRTSCPPLLFFLGLTAIPLSVPVSPLWAWEDHHLVTRASLADLPELRSATVPYTPVESLLRDLRYSSIQQFNESIQIRKEYGFPPQLGETEGAAVSILEVLAVYSDEPDWGMDKEIFGQYPEIWKDEYARMGGKEGTPSQAFRHMYWPEFSWRMPLRTLKSPVAKLFSPMGLAPERAALFVDLSRKARAAGHLYWSVRFVANALHYLEDVAQPFHAAQTPTKRFLLPPLLNRSHGNGLENYVLQVQNIVSYYHYAFERYIARQMKAHYAGESSPEGKALVETLAGELSDPPAGQGAADIAGLVVAMAGRSASQSAKAGQASMDFFPPIQARFDSFDPEQTVHSDGWWEETARNGKIDSAAKREYSAVVQETFSRLGSAIRTVVHSEVLPMSPGR